MGGIGRRIGDGLDSTIRTMSTTKTTGGKVEKALNKTGVILPSLGRDGTLRLRVMGGSNGIGSSGSDGDDDANTTNAIAMKAKIRVIIVPSMTREDVLLEVLYEDDYEEEEDENRDHHIGVISSSDAIEDGGTNVEFVDLERRRDDDTGIGMADGAWRTFGPCSLRMDNRSDGTMTSSGRMGQYAIVDVVVDAPSHRPTLCGTVAGEEEGIVGASRRRRRSKIIDVVANIPEKFNIACRVDGGDIVVTGGNKIEGDVNLSTSNGGGITVLTKIRGYDVSLDTIGGLTGGENANDDDGGSSSTSSSTGGTGTIHVKKAIEARTLTIRSSSRVRARMLNVGSKLHIVASSSATAEKAMSILDNDDEGAVIDIGSVYVVPSGGGGESEARLIVNDIPDLDDRDDHRNRGLVRVKSSHGHIVVHARTTSAIGNFVPSSSAASGTGSTLFPLTPLIDLGGVNGSCDVLLEGLATLCSSADDDDDEAKSDCGYLTKTAIPSIPTMRIHFDSMSPESISTITSRGIWTRVGSATRSDSDGDRGGVHPFQHPSMTSITMDRKLEAEVRLLSVMTRTPLVRHVNVDANTLTSDEVLDIRRALMDVIDRTYASSSGNKDRAALAATALVLGDAGSASIDKGNNYDDRLETRQLPISIDTDAYFDGEYVGLDGVSTGLNYGDMTGRDDEQPPHRSVVHYAQGTMKNRSGEPDARSDVRGRGKINVNGAELQALHRFTSHHLLTSTHAAPQMLPPLLAVATDGIIKLETLSWFGSIARRYGLDEKEGKKDATVGGVGRQARRSAK
jgi:hypothetical protein